MPSRSHYEKGADRSGRLEEPTRVVQNKDADERARRTESRPTAPRRERTGGKAPASSADYAKTATFLAVGVGLTGVITYAYFPPPPT